MDDVDLIAAIANGDDNALRELFERHAPWVAVRLRRVLPAAVVEDVMQETFIAVWRSAGRFQGTGAVGAWIWGIARRQAALWSRQNGRAAQVLASPVVEDPENVAIRAADLDAALNAIGPDGAAQRELLTMIYVEDRPIGDVAARLGVPPGTVKSRLFKARQRLRAALLGPEQG